MKLTDQVEQFMYTHPIQHHKKELIAMIRNAEEAYLKRIAELQQDQAVKEFDRMINEGSPDRNYPGMIDFDDEE